MLMLYDLAGSPLTQIKFISYAKYRLVTKFIKYSYSHGWEKLLPTTMSSSPF